MTEREDAFGRLVLDFLEERPAEIVERDDGDIGVSGGAAAYFAPMRRWPAPERRALRLVRGRVLDVGVGGGRVALELQERGHEVARDDQVVEPEMAELAEAGGWRLARTLDDPGGGPIYVGVLEKA